MKYAINQRAGGDVIHKYNLGGLCVASGLKRILFSLLEDSQTFPGVR